MKTASASKNIGFFETVSYWYSLLRMRLKNNPDLDIIPWNDFKEYDYFLNKYGTLGKTLATNKVLEVGFGARPWRLMTLNSLGVDIHGIDLERPTYGFNIGRLYKVLINNGFERFLKSLIRGVLFDLNDLKKINSELEAKGKKLILDETRMKVGNACDRNHFEENKFTFVYSEDVLEHIPASELPKLIDNLSYWLKKDSILLLRPHIYTGISGGHDPDWYPHKVLQKSTPSQSAWGHLLDPNYKVNTYLNKLRLKDYLKLFEDKFDVIEIKQKYDNLGESYLTDELFAKLNLEYSREELLTNQVAFILRVK